ncbi:hypothetical protein [Levilactobacillus tujiorum]|nr:hypothetical protein [Levilactobacillus tujiorum]NLR32346.1 hypothetical protein [Levilactobacillus tujiorum]
MMPTPYRSPNLDWDAVGRTGQAKERSCPSLEAEERVFKSPFTKQITW